MISVMEVGPREVLKDHSRSSVALGAALGRTHTCVARCHMMKVAPAKLAAPPMHELGQLSASL